MRTFSTSESNCDEFLLKEDVQDFMDRNGSVVKFSIISRSNGDLDYVIAYVDNENEEKFTITESTRGFSTRYEIVEKNLQDESNQFNETIIYDIATAKFILKKCDLLCECTENNDFLGNRFETVIALTDNTTFLVLYLVINSYRIGVDIGNNYNLLDLEELDMRGKMYNSFFSSVDELYNAIVHDVDKLSLINERFPIKLEE